MNVLEACGLSVIFSSHVVAELDRVADYLIVLNRGRLQVAADVEDLVASHVVLTGPASAAQVLRKRVSVVAATALAPATTPRCWRGWWDARAG